MGKFIFGIIIGFIIVAAAGVAFIESGGMPVATKGGPLPLERWVARTSIHAAIGATALEHSPIPVSDANLLAGAKAYMNDCAGCHGTLERHSGMAKAMYPHPPQFFGPNHHGVTDDPVGETYWKIKNGIRLSGMPAFVDFMKDDEIWQVSLFLKNADQLPDSAKQALEQGAR